MLAEQGKLTEAIKLFEAVEKDDELGPSAYRSLADWYLVENRREQHEKAKTAIYKTTEEYRLNQRIDVLVRPWQVAGDGRLPIATRQRSAGGLQGAVREVAVAAELSLALEQFYQASRDFRLLSMLTDGVVGHSAGKVYPFLQGMHSVLERNAR